MGITAKQAEARRNSVGSSDVAAIMGIDPRRSAFDVWCEKTGRTSGFQGNEHTWRGTHLEPALGRMAADKLGVPVVAPKGPFVRGRCRAHVDFQTPQYGKGNEIIEAKTAAWPDGWGEPGTDEVPDHVLLQVSHQMLCAESYRAHVARLGGRLDFSLYVVERDNDVCDHIEYSVEKFWRDYVDSDTPPPMGTATAATMDYLCSRERDAGAVTAVPAHVVAEFHACREARLAAEKAEQQAKAVLLQSLGDATVGEADGWHVAFGMVKRKPQLSHKIIEQNDPELAQELLERFGVVGTSYRQLRVKEVKASG